MKRVPLLLLLVLSVASGALAHRFREVPSHESHTGQRPRLAAPRSEPPGAGGGTLSDPRLQSASAAECAQVLKKGILLKELQDAVMLEETLEAMSPADYLLVLRALAFRDGREQELDEIDPVVRALVERAAAADVHGLLAFAEEGKSAARMRVAGGACFRIDPDATLAAARRLESRIGKTEWKGLQGLYYTLVAEGLWEENPVPALQAMDRSGLLNTPWIFGPYDSMEDAVARWAGKDLPAAMAYAERHPFLLYAAVNAWAAQDVEAVMAWLDQRPDCIASAFVQQTERLVPTDEAGVPRWREELLKSYALTHPLEAAAFGNEVADSRAFLQKLAEGMSRQPVGTAAAWVESLPEDQRTNATYTMLHQSGREGEGFTREFCRSYSPILQEPKVIEWMTKRYPQELAETLLSAPLPEAERSESLTRIIQLWGLNSPPAADAFVQSLPPGELRGRLLMASTNLLMYGREDAIAYALKLPDTAQQLGALRFIQSSPQGQPGEWISALPDPALREALLQPPPEGKP